MRRWGAPVTIRLMDLYNKYIRFEAGIIRPEEN